MPTKVISVRNVNWALWNFVREAASATPDEWRVISPRGLETIEYRGTWITEYQYPNERVLFSFERDANPFFHLMESLWILAGRDDLEFLQRYNSNMHQFSDDGTTFHAPYGYRLRRWFKRFSRLVSTERANEPEYNDVDQIAEVIQLLRTEPDTRRAVMCIWDPAVDCNVQSKDIPCNDLLMFKLREGLLDLTVSCRSNDVIWGAYGANAVQFSMLLEFVASAVGVNVGQYKQLSDSMHIYTSNAAWPRLREAYAGDGILVDPYVSKVVAPLPLFSGMSTDDWPEWLSQCETFVRGNWSGKPMCQFFTQVAYPVARAWDAYKGGRTVAAFEILMHDCAALDWRRACIEWLRRRA